MVCTTAEAVEVLEAGALLGEGSVSSVAGSGVAVARAVGVHAFPAPSQEGGAQQKQCPPVLLRRNAGRRIACH